MIYVCWLIALAEWRQSSRGVSVGVSKKKQGLIVLGMSDRSRLAPDAIGGGVGGRDGKKERGGIARGNEREDECLLT